MQTLRILIISLPICLEYPRIEDAIQAVKSKEVEGMLLDRFTASYYQSRGKLKSLITVKKLQLQRDVGILFSRGGRGLQSCLRYYRSNIFKSAQAFNATYKVLFTPVCHSLRHSLFKIKFVP